MFKTKTCPNCKIAEKLLSDAGIEYQTIDAQENEELTRQYDVMQAPTLVVLNDENVSKFSNASNIRKYIDEAGK